jgi:hypothetical protein
MAALLSSRGARADTEPIRIRFTAHEGCPTGDAFTGEVQARTARARLANEGEDARTFTVTVTARGTGSHGQLTIRTVDGATAVREVSGRACAEVVSALALITALAIDPKASTAPQPIPPPAPVPPEPPPGPVTPPVAPFFPPAAAPRGQSLYNHSNTYELWHALPPPLPVLPSSPVHRWRFAVGLHPAFVFGISPDPAPGFAVFAEAARDEPDILVPSFRVWATRASSEKVETDSGVASFRWTALRIDGCAVRVGDEEVSATGCLTAEGGALEGYGAVAKIRPWFSVGVLGRLQWVILDVVQLEAQGGLNLPLVRDTFFFEGDIGAEGNPEQITISETPAVGGLVGAGVGIRFP